MIQIKDNFIEILILSVIIALIFYSSEPVLYPDSMRYLNRSLLLDPPLYPTIIYILQLIFGNLNSVIFFQTLLMGFGIIYFTRTLFIHFKIDIITKTLTALFLLLPIFQFYNHLLTEPISYALSLFFVSSVIKLIYNFNKKNLFWNSIFILALLLTRNQFIFIYLVILFLYCGILLIHNSKKKFILLTISFIFIFLIHSSVINLNKYLNQKSFNQTLLNNKNGIYFFTYIDAIYISSEKDIKLFKNENLKETLGKIFNEMDKKKALVNYYNSRGHYALSFKEIRNYSDELLEKLAIKEQTTIISLKKKISLKLITTNFDKYIKHIFKKFYDSTWLFVFVPFFMLVAGLIKLIEQKSSFSLLVVFVSLFTLANHSIIYLFGRVQPRYLIYTDFILLIFIFITFSIFLRKKN